MVDAVRMEIKGIKCDAEGCDYKDMDCDFDDDYFLNKPCPKCGANLLTQEDYDSLQLIKQMHDIVNHMFSESDLDEEEETYKIPMSADGTGKVTIGKIEKVDKDGETDQS